MLIILETAVSTLSNVDTCVLTTCNLAINISNIELPLTFSLLILLPSESLIAPILSAISADFIIASVSELINVALTCCCTAVLALSVILGAMAFFFWLV